MEVLGSGIRRGGSTPRCCYEIEFHLECSKYVLNQTPHEERSIIDWTKFHLITLVIDMCPFFEMWDLALKVLGVLLGGKFDPLEPVEPQTEG